MKNLIAIISIILAIILIIIGYQRLHQPLVSVIMLTYKRADILPQAIESILNQTYQNFEFIILNDGSPDNTDAVVKAYMSQDKRIRYYKNDKNRGIGYSRNRVASLAKGKYVMIMDDDDQSLPERMQKQVEFLEKHQDITVVSGQIMFSNWPEIPQDHDTLASTLIQKNSIGNDNTMYRKSFVEKHHIKYPQLNYGEDWYFWLEILFTGGKFAAIPESTVKRAEFSERHYTITHQYTQEIVNDFIGRFFSPNNPQAFFHATPCEKLKMINTAPVKILSDKYLHQLMQANCL